MLKTLMGMLQRHSHLVVTSVVVPTDLEILMASNTPERIVHLSDTYLPRRCGILTSLGVLTGALAEAGAECLTVVPSHPKLAERDGLFQLPSIPSGVVGLRLAWPGEQQLEHVAAWRPDLVHVHTPGPAGLLGVLVGRQLGVPVVHTHHSDAQSQAVANQAPALMARLGLRLFAARLGTPVPPTGPGLTGAIDGVLTLMMRDADAVIVPGRSVLGRSVLPVSEDRIFIVPSGLAGQKTEPDAGNRFRARYGIARDDRVVLFVGRVAAEKNVQLLVDSFRLLRRQVATARLVLVGQVYHRRWLRRLLGQTAGVSVIGQQPPEVVAEAFAGAEILALPSLTDVQALVQQEAAMAGVPTVLTDVGLHRYGPLGGATVLAAPEPVAYAEALRGLLCDPERAQAIGIAARNHALEHTPERFAAQVRDVYALAAAHRLSRSA